MRRQEDADHGKKKTGGVFCFSSSLHVVACLAAAQLLNPLVISAGGYTNAEVTWNHHEHGRAISGSCILKYFNGYLRSVDLETPPQKKCLHQLSCYTDNVLIWIWSSRSCIGELSMQLKSLGQVWGNFQLAALTSLATSLLSLKMC